MRPAPLQQLRGEAHELERFRSRIRRRPNFLRQVILDGADQPGGKPQRSQNSVNQVRCRGLAIRSGDPCKKKALVRRAVPSLRRDRQSPPAVLYLNPRMIETRRTSELAHHRDRTPRDRVLSEYTPVCASPLKRDKHLLRLHTAGIEFDSTNRQRRQIICQTSENTNFGEKLTKRHLPNWTLTCPFGGSLAPG